MAKKKGKMFESKFDEEALSKCIDDGLNADQIQEKLGIASKQSLRAHVMKLMNIQKRFIDVPLLYVRNQKLPMVNFKQELRLTKKMLQGGNFQHGDRFEIDQMDNSKIVLSRITGEVPSAKTEPESKE